MAEKDVSMATKDSMNLWFIGNGCEDHSASSSSISGSSSTPQGIILTPGEYEEYLRLTQVTKSSSIASVA